MRGMGKQTHKRLSRAVASRGLERVCFTIEHLSRVVDRRLAAASETVIRAANGPRDMRELEMSFARADYCAAHVVASLVDERCRTSNAWPAFPEWAGALARASAAGL